MSRKKANLVEETVEKVLKSQLAPMLGLSEASVDAIWQPAKARMASAPGQTSAAPKRSTEKNEAQVKLIAALTRHHGYENGSCSNFEPIASNELARQAHVAKSTASTFFKNEFDNHRAYKNACMNRTKLVAMLKLLNNEYRPHHLLGLPVAKDDSDE